MSKTTKTRLKINCSTDREYYKKNDKIYISNIAKIQTFDSTKIQNYKRYYVIFLAWKFKWKFGDSASKLFVYPL